MEKEISLGTNLYDINKQLVEQFDSPLSKEQLNQKKTNILLPYFKEKIEKEQHKYFMLLCNDERYYTVFEIFKANYNLLNKEVLECLNSIGLIYSIEQVQDNAAIEIWIKNILKNELFCYYLFPYDEGIIPIQ